MENNFDGTLMSPPIRPFRLNEDKTLESPISLFGLDEAQLNQHQRREIQIEKSVANLNEADRKRWFLNRKKFQHKERFFCECLHLIRKYQFMPEGVLKENFISALTHIFESNQTTEENLLNNLTTLQEDN